MEANHQEQEEVEAQMEDAHGVCTALVVGCDDVASCYSIGARLTVGKEVGRHV